MDNSKVLNKDPEDFLNYLCSSLLVEVPGSIETQEDMGNASKLILKLSSSISYLSYLTSLASIKKRQLQKSGDKDEYEKMIDRCETCHIMLKALNEQKSGISRAMTTYIEHNNELRMINRGM